MPNYQGGRDNTGPALDWQPTPGGGFVATDEDGDVLTLTPSGSDWAWTAARDSAVFASGTEDNEDLACTAAINAAL